MASTKVEYKVLRQAAKDLNDSDLLEKKLKIQGIKQKALEEVFMAAVDSIPEENDEKIPQTVFDLYEILSGTVSDASEKEQATDPKASEKKRDGGNESSAAKKAPKNKAPKRPGIIAMILTTIEKKGPIDLDGIHTVLIKEFPDKDADSMKATLKAQISGKKRPLRMEREKDVEFIIKDGKYSIEKK